MIAAMSVFAVLFIWGIGIVLVDLRAKRHQQDGTDRLGADPATIGDEAERWLQHH
jgi:hypothetical protein